MVYRDAEFPVPDVCRCWGCRRKCYLQFHFCVLVRTEGGRCGSGDLVGGMVRFGVGLLAVVAEIRGFKLEWCYVWDIARLRCFFDVNKDIFLRTLCLVAVTFMFTSAGARQGDVVLAVNTLLMQFFTLFSYVMDGFAYAGEALVGYYVGAQDSSSLRVAVRSLLKWGVAMALWFTIL